MMDHVSARCARYRLLIPSRNVEAITTLNENTRLRPLRIARQIITTVKPSEEETDEPPCPVLDLRRLLGEEPATPPCPRVQLLWVSTDSERRAKLIVDAVDEIVASRLHHLERVPFLPARLLPLCDGVMRDADATYRISVRPDVLWPVQHLSERKAWRRALVSIETSDSPSGASPSSIQAPSTKPETSAD